MTIDEVKQYVASNTPDPAIALAQAQAESGWRTDVIFGPTASPKGALGLFQFMPPTWAQYGGGADPFDPVASTSARNAYMADLLGMFSGDYAKSLAGYNWGQGRVQKAVQQYGGDWFAHIPVETRGYVQRILGNQTNFFRLLLKTLAAANKGKGKTNQI